MSVLQSPYSILSATTKLTITSSSPYAVPAWNFVVHANAGDTYQLFWATNNTHINIFAGPANTIYPYIPSIILTATQVRS